MPLLKIKSLDEIELNINKASSDTMIPKNIFQSWETEVVPDIVYERVQKMIRDNPEWNYYFFNKNLRREFIQRFFDDNVLYTYDNLIPGAYKVDLWQYCILKKFGGFYLDMKCLPVEKLDHIVGNSSTFIASRDLYNTRRAGDFYVYTAFLFSKPNQIFLEVAIKEIISNVKSGYYGSDQLLPTGPGLLGKALNIAQSKDPHTIIQPGVHRFNEDEYIIYPMINVQTGFGIDFDLKRIIDLGYGKVKSALITSINESIDKEKLFDYAIRWHCGLIYKHGKKPTSLIKRLKFNKNKFDLYLSVLFNKMLGLMGIR